MRINLAEESRQEDKTEIRGKNMKKILTLSLITAIALASTPTFAAVQKGKCTHSTRCTHGVNGKVTPKSIGAGALSLLVWPGVGQLMNDETIEKSAVHAILGFTGIFRIWSCYDAVVDRHGGVWENRI